MIRLSIVIVRTFIRPFSKVLGRRMREQASEHERDFFYRFGMRAYRFEYKVD